MALSKYEVRASSVIEELYRLYARAAGSVVLEGTLTGPRDAPQADVSGRGLEVVLMDKPFRNVHFEAAALLDPDELTAALRLTGNLDDGVAVKIVSGHDSHLLQSIMTLVTLSINK